MSAQPLRRAASGRAAAPVRIVHLGLGNFFRAHSAVYTELAPDGPEWGIAAFGGRSGELAARLNAQDGCYTLITRGPSTDAFRVINSVSAAYSGADDESWLRCLRDPAVTGLTLTVTEAGYRDPAVANRLVAGLTARRGADAGPITVLSCDNVPANGALVERVVLEAAERSDPGVADWIREQVRFPNTMVDRITPRPTPELTEIVADATGRRDYCPVVTEPFSEWVIAGEFAAARPSWEQSGARFVDDVEPYERRKLYLLNGGHSLLAYLGLGRGLPTVAAAVADEHCARWLRRWWAEADPLLAEPELDGRAYCDRLLERFANPRIAHQLSQIAADGSQKLAIRVVPVLRAHRERGDLPPAAIAIIAGWLRYRKTAGSAALDAALPAGWVIDADPPATVDAALLALDAGDLRDDAELVAALRQALA